jgi:hypothetical protein
VFRGPARKLAWPGQRDRESAGTARSDGSSITNSAADLNDIDHILESAAVLEVSVDSRTICDSLAGCLTVLACASSGADL